MAKRPGEGNSVNACSLRTIVRKGEFLPVESAATLPICCVSPAQHRAVLRNIACGEYILNAARQTCSGGMELDCLRKLDLLRCSMLSGPFRAYG
jgi:hypothetical protein